MSERVFKKLVPSLQDVDGAILMINAKDPQLATFMLFVEAVSNLPNFVVINKVDSVSETEAQVLAGKFPDRQIVLTSLLTSRGLDEIKSRLDELEGKVVVLGIFNSGKTSLINALTGEDNPIGKIPGTTLKFSEHKYKHLVLMDSVGQIIDVSKPLMVSLDLTGCATNEEKLRRCLTQDASGILSSIELAIPGLLKAVDLIIRQVNKGGKIVVVGAGASALVAREIGGQSQETGLPVLVFTNDFADSQPISFAKGIGEMEAGLSEYFIRAVNPADVAIGVSASGGTGFTYRFLELAREKGAKTIAITENSDTPLGDAADVIIKSDAKPEGPSSSKIQVAHLAIGHALVLTIADTRGVDAEASIQFMLPMRIPSKKMGIK